MIQTNNHRLFKWLKSTRNLYVNPMLYRIRIMLQQAYNDFAMRFFSWNKQPITENYLFTWMINTTRNIFYYFDSFDCENIVCLKWFRMVHIYLEFANPILWEVCVLNTLSNVLYDFCWYNYWAATICLRPPFSLLL